VGVYKIIEWVGLKGSFKDHLFQPLFRGQGHLSLDQVPQNPALSSLAWNTSRDGASTTSLGNRFWCLSTLIVKNFFLMPSVNLPSFSLKPLPLVLLLQALIKVSLHLSYKPPLSTERPQ